MDERQVREIAKRIFQMMMEKEIISHIKPSVLPVAYVLLSERWQEYDSDLFNDTMNFLREKYQCVLVSPDERDKGRFLQAAGCNIVTGDDIAGPVEGSVSFFPIPCRDLIIKTALCLSDDFSSRWVRRCMETGSPVYMRKEQNLFTGKESKLYQQKVLSYYKEAEAYGIRFLEENQSLGPILQGTEGAEGTRGKIGKYITMADLEGTGGTKVFWAQEGDRFTALAQEYMEKSGIRVVTCSHR